MTVSTTTNKASHSGTGSQTVFPYTFKIFADADLKVIIRAADGTESPKDLTTHYTVSGAGTENGGNVTFTTGNVPTDTETVVIQRKLSLTQGTDYVANDPFPAESHEDALDRLTFITQQIQEELDRSIKASVTNTISSTDFSISATDRANKLLSFDGSGDLTVTEGKVDTVTATSSAVSAGGAPTATATYTASSGALALAFGLVTGNTGATGPQGAAGKNTGLAMTFSNSTSDADPGAGKVAFNHGTTSSVTQIFVDDVDDSSATVSSFVQSWDDVSNTTARGILLITKETDPSVYGLFKVTGAVTNASGYSKVPVTHVVSNGSFSNSDGIQVSFAYSGADGATGATGAAGSDGSDGSDGAAASIAVNTVTTNTLTAGSSATVAVSNAGSSSAAQLNFTFGVPAGATGATGPQGAQGPAGGGLSDVVSDTSPQLGADLDTNNFDIVTTSNRDIDLAPNGTGKVVVKGNTNPGTVVFNCESNSHGQTVKSQPHSASVTNTLTLPAGSDQEIVGTSATQTLTNKTISGGSISSTTTATTQSAGDSSTKIATTAFATAAVANEATALAIALG